MGFSRQEYWSGFPFPLHWTTFCQTSPPWPIHLGWPHTAWLSFIELNKAVVYVMRLASCLWSWFQFVCPLMSSLSTYHLAWVSLTLKPGGCNGSTEAHPRGATPCPRSGAMAERSYPTFKVRSSGCTLLEQQWREVSIGTQPIQSTI